MGGSSLHPTMKSTKSPRIGMSHRSRSSRTADSLASQLSPTQIRRPLLSTTDQNEPQMSTARTELTPNESRSSPAETEDGSEIAIMKRKMSEALALKQLQNSTSGPSNNPVVSRRQTDANVPPAP